MSFNIIDNACLGDSHGNKIIRPPYLVSYAPNDIVTRNILRAPSSDSFIEFIRRGSHVMNALRKFTAALMSHHIY